MSSSTRTSNVREQISSDYGRRVELVCVLTPFDLASLRGSGDSAEKSGLSGKQQLFKLKCVRATTAGEIPPDYIIIEGQIPLEALLPG